jgi:[ribosomal protein S5]-alanine N-acetyltransferase
MAALPDDWSTPRLHARQPRLDDAQTIFEGFATDDRVTRYLTWRPHRVVEDARQFIAACIEAWDTGGRCAWALTRFAEDTVIGMIELRLEGHRAELGYVLARPAWGQGFMTEAVQALTQMALHEVPVARVAAVCDVDNVASARVLEKSGLVREGRLARYIVHPNISDEPRDVYLYARTRPLHASMPEETVLRVLATLSERNVPVWVAGGWGIDALLGEQTRTHADLDLAYRVEDEPALFDGLAQLGYRIVLDHRPSRIAVADDAGHEVDLHPVRFDVHGFGVQAGLHGEAFHYPANGFTTGLIGRTRVGCLTAEQQLRFHTGYQPRDRDRLDLARLKGILKAYEQ